MRQVVWVAVLVLIGSALFGQGLGGASSGSVYQGKVDLGRDIASLQANPPEVGTLYLLSGLARSVVIRSEEPFLAEVELIQSFWDGEEALRASAVTVRFEGEVWKDRIAARRPRTGAEELVYPYRKFQVAALADAQGLRAIAVPLFFN